MVLNEEPVAVYVVKAAPCAEQLMPILMEQWRSCERHMQLSVGGAYLPVFANNADEVA